jgi:large subunit ribosomal protein L17
MVQSKFKRDRDQRQLLFRNLATSVILYESVITTEAKARAVQPIIERLISIGKESDQLRAKRRLSGFIPDKNAVKKILDELTIRYKDRSSGFTKRIRVMPRLGDGASQSMIQLTDTVLLQTPQPSASDTKKEAPAKK